MEQKSPISTTTGINIPMSVEALVAMVRRHVPLYATDPDFVDYIINLALYLIEIGEGDKPAQAAEPPSLGQPVNLTPSNYKRLTRAAKREPVTNCRFCGSPTNGKRVCPNCGHMV